MGVFHAVILEGRAKSPVRRDVLTGLLPVNDGF
jgi:hypothetical protein